MKINQTSQPTGQKLFSQEFRHLSALITSHQTFLLFAHNSPDADTTGAVLAFGEHLTSLGKQVVFSCFDPFPAYLADFSQVIFCHPDNLNLAEFHCVIAIDSVERGFEKVISQLDPTVHSLVLIDHHPHIKLEGTITIIDPTYSSTCEILYQFFKQERIPFSRTIANYLMLGILGDTGNFQHANTSSQVMEIASELMKHGASLPRIIENIFSNKNLATLKLWGKALEKSKIIPQNGMIVTILTQTDIQECAATNDDISQVSSILNTVPGTRFALVLSERGDNIIKGSLRSEEYKGVDVSLIARSLGGGGHRLASGFELHGKIVETENGWQII